MAVLEEWDESWGPGKRATDVIGGMRERLAEEREARKRVEAERAALRAEVERLREAMKGIDTRLMTAGTSKMMTMESWRDAATDAHVMARAALKGSDDD